MPQGGFFNPRDIVPAMLETAKENLVLSRENKPEEFFSETNAFGLKELKGSRKSPHSYHFVGYSPFPRLRMFVMASEPG